ncbi:MAG: hypothetical protein M1130_07910 [Actinobacteria bacterium]|nr:hypothetical protein [Actinomycetota bacterium]
MTVAVTGSSVLLVVMALILVIFAIKIIKGVIRMFLILGVLVLALWYFTKML